MEQEVSVEDVEETRPKWDFPVHVETVKFFRDHITIKKAEFIEKIDADWNSHISYELTCENGDVETITSFIAHELGLRFGGTCGIVTVGPQSEDMFRRLDAIEKYDKKHAKDLATYRRLKKKFEGA